MESRWAPKRIEKFLGMAPILVLVSPSAGAREKGSSHWAVVFASNYPRMDRKNVCKPYYFHVSEPVWRAE